MRLRISIVAGVLFAMTSCAWAQDCYQSSILSPSPLWATMAKSSSLADGSLWEVKLGYEYLYEYYPDVDHMFPSRGKLAIKGKMLNMGTGWRKEDQPESQTREAPAAEVIESQIDGEFSGWDEETIFKLTNGQIWQQAAYAYTYSYKYRPRVLIFRANRGYKMQVEGIDKRIRVVRLK